MVAREVLKVFRVSRVCFKIVFECDLLLAKLPVDEQGTSETRSSKRYVVSCGDPLFQILECENTTRLRIKHITVATN